VIGFSSPLAYCTIFIIMSSEVVDLHICICICTSHCLYLCRIRCTPQLRCRSRPPTRRPSFRPDFTCLLACDCRSRDRRCVQTAGTISGHFSSQTLLNEDRQFCESWREEELAVHAVCAVGDTTDEDR